MTETPSSFAGTPGGQRTAEPDLLTEMLKAVRLNGAVFLSARLRAPFGVIDPRTYDQRTPMARLRRISIFHLIVAGECQFETAGETFNVSAGDLIFMGMPGEYSFRSGEPAKIVQASETVKPGPIEGMWTVDYGGGGAELRMVCGFVESSELHFAPLFHALPATLIERTSTDRVGQLIASTVREIVTLVDGAIPGTQAVLGRLMELLFIEMLRRQASLLPDGSLTDPVVARALQLLHAEPQHRWTIDQIASRAGTSRTVLTDRFKVLLGRPPIDYLAGWRIQLAAERLRAGSESVPRIAASVGYESEAAFNRAFKRITGLTPGNWRAGASSTQ